MAPNSAKLAREITWKSSKQTYFTIALMVDRDLIDDAYRAYGYFRWMDDYIDQYTWSESVQEAFLRRQRSLAQRAYDRQEITDPLPEERILIDLIHHDRGVNSRLKTYIQAMMELMAFDASRKGQPIHDEALHVYTDLLATGVMDALQYFIGNRCSYPMTVDRNQAVVGAHITHMLRDTLEDLELGYVNIPLEVLEASGMDPADVHRPEYRAWVKSRVELARRYFDQGTAYIDSLSNVRCRIVGHWYCARFMCVLNAIERDQYQLRRNYDDLKGYSQWLKVAWLAALVPLLHLLDGLRLRRTPQGLNSQNISSQ
jgi:phytoene/squalene synthetase